MIAAERDLYCVDLVNMIRQQCDVKMSQETKLRQFEREIDSWRCRIKDANDRKTCDEVFDKRTLMTIYKLFSDGVFDRLDFPISTGKEANVFRGITVSGDFVAIKIFRLSTATFKNLGKYLHGDPRFKKVARRFPDIIFAWAEKEFRNLERFNEIGIKVPGPLAVHRNILVMEYIGDEISPAKTLKEVGPSDPTELADYLLGCIRKAYSKVRIVHGDLSEYNVLMAEEGPVIIDLGQAVLLDHWMAQELLERDVFNMARYFKKFGVEIDVNSELKRIRENKLATS